MKDGLVGVSRHVENSKVGVLRHQPIGKILSVHLGHDDIGKYEVNWSVVLLANAQCLDTVRGS
jgi:hypothetical protein